MVSFMCRLFMCNRYIKFFLIKINATENLFWAVIVV